MSGFDATAAAVDDDDDDDDEWVPVLHQAL